MNIVIGPGWTQDRVAQLEALASEGLSASEISRQLGGISRNGVIGKLRRLGIPLGIPHGRQSLPGTTPTPRRVRKPRMVPRPLPEPESHSEPAMSEHSSVTGIPLERTGFNHCRWPLWDLNGGPEFPVCGERPARIGDPYCATHAAKSVGMGTHSERMAAKTARQAVRAESEIGEAA